MTVPEKQPGNSWSWDLRQKVWERESQERGKPVESSEKAALAAVLEMD